ncbi:MAG: CpXC domain-containing protein [Bacteroidales bacterium]|nr:CpXC domain-containing protein [Bacteroidales bacterium]
MADGTVRARCRRCGAEEDIPAWNIINAQENPELRAELLEGKLFLWTCPRCGSDNLIKYPLLYHDPTQKLLLWLTDGVPEVEARMAETIASEEGLQDYSARIVDTPGEMMEKIKIAEAGLDDVAMEICKYVTAQEMGKTDVDFKFFRLEGADRRILLTYPEGGEMQVVGTGFSVYEDAAGIVGRNPELAVHGLVKVNADWLSQHIG